MTDAPAAPRFAVSGFKSAAERVRNEAVRRAALVARRLPFSVRFLDDAIGGILPNDLVLLGARTGAGKTQLATQIAESAVLAGKRVHFFALEAEPDEIERRIKYRMLYHYVDQRSAFISKRFSYRAWYMGQLDGNIPDDISAKAEAVIGERFRTLKTFYRDADFTIDTLEQVFLAIQGETDLVILDHLHYIDDDGEENENRAYKRIVKRIRDLALSASVPVICVAHLRKKERRGAPLMPDLEDFHGSSDITKVATHAILLAPAYDQPTGKPWLWSTYMSVAKDRRDGAKPYVALLTFNVRTGSYDRDYELGRLDSAGTSWKPIPIEELPQWASGKEQREIPVTRSREPGEDDA